MVHSHHEKHTRSPIEVTSRYKCVDDDREEMLASAAREGTGGGGVDVIGEYFDGID